jgi:hypothetical protein
VANPLVQVGSHLTVAAKRHLVAPAIERNPVGQVRSNEVEVEMQVEAQVQVEAEVDCNPVVSPISSQST